MAHVQTNDRVGHQDGSKAFILDVAEQIFEEKLRNTHDTVVFYTWKESFDLRGFSNGDVWRKAIFEGWGTSMLVWLTGLATYSLSPTVP
jgi:hypothetical protein